MLTFLLSEAMNDDLQRQYLINVMGLSPEEIDNLPPAENAKKESQQPEKGAFNNSVIFEKYYKEQFPHDLRMIMEQHGHSHGEEGTYISIQLLTKKNILQHVAEDHFVLFFSFLSLTILLDELMYTHFRDKYPSFRATTMYPKVEYGITWCHVHPWRILRTPSGREAEHIFHIFKRCSEIFLEDCRKFFRQESMQGVAWKQVEQTMRDDPDVGKGMYGQVFMDALKGEYQKERKPPPIPPTSEKKKEIPNPIA